jgi:cell division septum initiation protein DivIVA
MRGFDRDEVQLALHEIASQSESLLDENESMRKQLKHLEAALASYRREDSTFKGAVLMVQEQCQQIRERAQLDAERILEQARAQADDITADARSRVYELERQVLQLESRWAHVYSTLEASTADLQQLLTMVPHPSVLENLETLANNDGRADAATAIAHDESKPEVSESRQAEGPDAGDEGAERVSDATGDAEPASVMPELPPPARPTLVHTVAAGSDLADASAGGSAAKYDKRSDPDPASGTVTSASQMRSLLKEVDALVIEVPGLPPG